MQKFSLHSRVPGCGCRLLLLICLHLLPQLRYDSMQLRNLSRTLNDFPGTRLQLLRALIGLPSPCAKLLLSCAEHSLQLTDFRPCSSQRAIACCQLCLEYKTLLSTNQPYSIGTRLQVEMGMSTEAKGTGIRNMLVLPAFGQIVRWGICPPGDTLHGGDLAQKTSAYQSLRCGPECGVHLHCLRCL